MTLYERSTDNGRGFHDVSPHLVQEAAGKVRIVDVREPAEAEGELGRIPGAELVPLGRFPHAALAWDRDAEIVLVCRSGGRSALAAESLVRLGFRRVMNLEGGMLALRASGAR